jgi:hypothetical protein
MPTGVRLYELLPTYQSLCVPLSEIDTPLRNTRILEAKYLIKGISKRQPHDPITNARNLIGISPVLQTEKSSYRDRGRGFYVVYLDVASHSPKFI